MCDEFNGNMQGIISWTEKYMAACTYTKSKKNGPDETNTIKDGAKFIKKWKKVVGAFHHGAVNQPNGPLCKRDWEASYN